MHKIILSQSDETFTYKTWDEVLRNRRIRKAKRFVRKAKPVVAGIAATVGFIAMIGITGRLDYEAECVRCDKATYYNGFLITPDGNVWGYEAEDLTDNEIVSVTFHTNGTDDLTDDTITFVKGLGEYQNGNSRIAAIHETEWGCLIQYADSTGYYCEY